MLAGRNATSQVTSFFMQRIITLLLRQPLLSGTGYGLEVRSLAQFGTLARPSLLLENGPAWSWTLLWERTMAPLGGNSISPALPCTESSPVATDSLDIRLDSGHFHFNLDSFIFSTRAQWLLRPQALHGEGKAGEAQHIKDIVDP